MYLTLGSFKDDLMCLRGSWFIRDPFRSIDLVSIMAQHLELHVVTFKASESANWVL